MTSLLSLYFENSPIILLKLAKLLTTMSHKQIHFLGNVYLSWLGLVLSLIKMLSKTNTYFNENLSIV